MTDKSDLKKRIRARQDKTGEAYTTAREHVLRTGDNAPAATTITATVLKCCEMSLRLRVLTGGEPVTFRCSAYDAMRIAPAQLVEVVIRKRWTWHSTAHASGDIVRVWTDISALKLEPLTLEDHGVMELTGVCEGFEPPDPYAQMWAFFAATPRRAFEFESAACGAAVGGPEACLVGEAAEVIHSDQARARELLMESLLGDLRCIDAHVHLGILVDVLPQDAIVHYEIALAIGEQALGQDFTSMLPWACLDNRPFLRALHGYGLCLWRLGRMEAAQAAFERLLSLNPLDNQGARMCWDSVRKGHAWALAEDPQDPQDGPKLGLPA